MKKILVVDDSALMRRVMCDIINADERFRVVDRATNGEEALALLIGNTYDAVILDINMPKMNGLELLKELQNRKIIARVIVASTDTREGEQITLDALSLGAIDFLHKPDNPMECKTGKFGIKLINILATVCESKVSAFEENSQSREQRKADIQKLAELASKASKNITMKQIVAIASSTGGPRALQDVIPQLPKGLKAPVVLVQHMPAGFTKSLAQRLDSLSEVEVSEAEDGEILKNGHVYIARGGAHLNVDSQNGVYRIRYSDEPAREGVKPCANYMYESLMDSFADRIVCVVMTGMGADGTKGITNLKTKKKTYVITQDEESCTVYGMPKSAVAAGLSDQVVTLKKIAQEIIMSVGTN